MKEVIKVIMISFSERVYSISRRNGQWKVNKTIYLFEGENEKKKGYVDLLPEHEKYNPYKSKYRVTKKIEDVFLTREEAQQECERRNGVVKD